MREMVRTKDDDSDVDRAQYTEFIGLLEQPVLTLIVIDRGVQK